MRIRTLMCAVYSNQSNRRDGYINIYIFLSDFESDDGWISSKPDIFSCRPKNISNSLRIFQNKAIVPKAIYCFRHCFLYARNVCIIVMELCENLAEICTSLLLLYYCDHNV